MGYTALRVGYIHLNWDHLRGYQGAWLFLKELQLNVYHKYVLIVTVKLETGEREG